MSKFTKNSDCLLIRSMSVILTALADLTRKITEILEVEFFQRVVFFPERRMASFQKVVIFQKGIKTRVKHDRDATELLKFAISPLRMFSTTTTTQTRQFQGICTSESPASRLSAPSYLQVLSMRAP